jgi:hypothetical protein
MLQRETEFNVSRTLEMSFPPLRQMNRRKRGSKYEFEPKIPVEGDETRLDGGEAFMSPASQELRDRYPPRPIENSLSKGSLDLTAQSGCLFLLPGDLDLREVKLVVFEDGSVGFRTEDGVHGASFYHVGSALAVEHGASATSIGEAEFLVSYLDGHERAVQE